MGTEIRESAPASIRSLRPAPEGRSGKKNDPGVSTFKTAFLTCDQSLDLSCNVVPIDSLEVTMLQGIHLPPGPRIAISIVMIFLVGRLHRLSDSGNGVHRGSPASFVRMAYVILQSQLCYVKASWNGR